MTKQSRPKNKRRTTKRTGVTQPSSVFYTVQESKACTQLCVAVVFASISMMQRVDGEAEQP